MIAGRETHVDFNSALSAAVNELKEMEDQVRSDDEIRAMIDEPLEPIPAHIHREMQEYLVRLLCQVDRTISRLREARAAGADADWIRPQQAYWANVRSFLKQQRHNHGRRQTTG
jgi:hypothetical protein